MKLQNTSMILETRWNANHAEFEADTEKNFKWVFLVESFAYTKFNKSEDVESYFTNIEPYEAFIDEYHNGQWIPKRVKVIGKKERSCLSENFDRLIVVRDEVIHIGVHPSVIYLQEEKS